MLHKTKQEVLCLSFLIKTLTLRGMFLKRPQESQAGQYLDCHATQQRSTLKNTVQSLLTKSIFRRIEPF